MLLRNAIGHGSSNVILIEDHVFGTGNEFYEILVFRS